jgi:hypothetical protein
MSARRRPDLETVAIAYSQPELAVLLSYLANRGIRAMPLGYGHAALQWDWTIALGGIAIRVPAADAAAARDALSAIERRAYRGGIYTDTLWLDVALTLLVFVTLLVPPPARIPASIVFDSRSGRAEAG